VRKYLITSNSGINTNILNGDIYYISESCFYGKKCISDKQINNKIIPSPFDLETLEGTFAVITDTYVRLVDKLTCILNKINGVNFSNEYWDKLLSSWFIYFISIIYEKYLRISKAIDILGNDCFVVISKKSYSLLSVPFAGTDNIRDLDNNQNDEDFALYSNIAKIMKIRTVDIDYKQFHNQATFFEKSTVNRKALISILRKKIESILFTKNEKFVIFLPTYNTAYYSELKKIYPNVKVISAKKNILPREVDNNKRKTLLEINPKTEFENIIINLLPLFVPKVIIENYSDIRRKAEKYITNAVFFNSEASWHTNNVFLFAAAESKENFNSKLVHCQHGGGDGQYKYFVTEYIHRRIADYYFSYGWIDKYYEGAKIVPGLNIKLFPRNLKHNREKTLKSKGIFVSTNASPFVFRNNLWSTAEGLNKYFKDQLIFFERLDKTVLSNIKYRPYPSINYLWNYQNILKEKFPFINIDNTGNSVDVFKNARFLVIDHNSTALLQAFYLNIPTICYWDTDLYPAREFSKTDFENLKSVGILWDSPKRAAEKLNKNINNIEKWWYGHKIQRIQEQFAFKYANIDKNFSYKMKNFINNI
jgi:putative transferase (TIGR04331 family)